jgi:hypothetical protein
MALPMYVLYEVGIVSSGFFGKKKSVSATEALVPAVATAGAGGGVAGMSMQKSSSDEYVGVPPGGRRR